MNRQYRVSLHTVQDPDDDRVGGLPNLLSLDPVDEAYIGEGRELARSEDAEEAMALAEHLIDADPQALGQPRGSRRGIHGLRQNPTKPNPSTMSVGSNPKRDSLTRAGRACRLRPGVPSLWQVRGAGRHRAVAVSVEA